MEHHLYIPIEDLPEIIPVFPLSGVILLPRTTLPLNIFEPRYLAMVDDALAAKRYIGMVQPRLDADDMTARDTPPEIYNIGGIGKITSFAETDDGRYLITLTGISKFRIAEEISTDTPYRRVIADYKPFEQEIIASSQSMRTSRQNLLEALKVYLQVNNLDTDWESISTAPTDTLINSLAMICPFDPTEKQALLEAENVQDRCEILSALLQMASTSGSGGAIQ